MRGPPVFGGPKAGPLKRKIAREDSVGLKREPTRGNLPFERVTDELGKVDVQCLVCLGHSRVVDELALSLMRSRWIGRVRVGLIYPWHMAGTIRFLFRHFECMQDWTEASERDEQP